MASSSSSAPSSSASSSSTPAPAPSSEPPPKRSRTRIDTSGPGDIYQIKITLQRIRPIVWRRVQLRKDSTFLELHRVIISAMGWSGDHLFEFQDVENFRRNKRPTLVIRELYGGGETWDSSSSESESEVDSENETPIQRFMRLIPKDPKKKCSRVVKLEDVFKDDCKTFWHIYDISSPWTHKLTWEKTLPSKPGTTYPVCISGRRLCPIEDPTESEMEEMEDRPDTFDPKQVKFKRMTYLSHTFGALPDNHRQENQQQQ